MEKLVEICVIRGKNFHDICDPVIIFTNYIFQFFLIDFVAEMLHQQLTVRDKRSFIF